MARHTLIGLLLAAPALLGGLSLAWTALGPAPRDLREEFSFVEALRDDLFEIGYAYIRDGQDPNEPVPFQDAQLTGGKELKLTPLVIAVADGHSDSVLMLMSSGVRLDAPGNRYAVCLAERLGHESIAEMILRYGGEAAAAMTCPEAPHPEHAPLSAYVE